MRTFILLIIVFQVIGCVKSKEYADTPYLEFRGWSKSTMNQGRIKEDSVTITLFFTDGDGDFGIASNSTGENVFIKDLRTNEILRQYKAPFVPEEGAGNGISGTIKIKMYTTCCIFPPSSGIDPCERPSMFPTNDLPLEIYITDRAGNKSNVVQADVLTLNCK
ncbi:MAG: hypothetical protein IPN86_12925 [Saprospiraceae bacterium]|nr:hypothetical protein [Saprospiraceae bacterium]